MVFGGCLAHVPSILPWGVQAGGLPQLDPPRGCHGFPDGVQLSCDHERCAKRLMTSLRLNSMIMTLSDPIWTSARAWSPPARKP